MGTPIEKLPHSCGTRSGLQVFAHEDGTVDGYCFSCATFVRNPYGEERTVDDVEVKVKSQAEIDAEVAEVSGYNVFDWPKRKLSRKVLDYYDVKIGVSEKDGKTPETIYFPCTKDGKIVGYKVELMNSDEKNRRWSIGNTKNCDLLGWKQAIATGSKRLFITEGEKDMASLKSVLEKYSKPEYKGQAAVTSLTKGAGNARNEIARMLPDIKRHFKEVVLVFDEDDAGRKAIEDVCSILPTAMVANLPEKDANECVLQGKEKALYTSTVFNASPPKNSRLVFGEDLHEAAREPAKWGELSWPWQKINESTRNIRLGETIYVGAGVKMGKSEVVNAIGAHLIMAHDAKIFMAKPEEANKKTYKMLAGKITGNVFHDPKKEFNYDAFDRAGEKLRQRLAMVNLYQHLGWESLKQDIVAAVSWGAKAVFVDPITNLTNGMNASDANTKLQEVAQDISAMALDLGFVAFLFCHLKAPEGDLQLEARKKQYEKGNFIGLGNCPHERGGTISSSQFAGSRAMMRSCNYMIGIEGNKDEALDPAVRNTRNIRILEDREFGEVGTFPIRWSEQTGLFHEC